MPDRAINFGESEADTDFQMRQDGDDWILEHLPSGATFEYDASEDAWIPTAPIGTASRPVPRGTFDSVSTEELKTAPTGSIVQLDGNQTVATGTLTKVKWSSETTRGTASNLLDGSNNTIIVPDGFNWVIISVSIRWETALEVDVFEVTINNAEPIGAPARLPETTARSWSTVSSWIPTSANDEIGFNIRQQSGGDATIEDQNETWMEVRLI